MRSLVARAAIAVASLLIAGTVHAQILIIDNWGSYADSYVYNCSSPDCNGGGTFGAGAAFGPEVDLYQQGGATSSIDEPLGSATATASFINAAPGLNTMLFTGEAEGAALGIANARARALDYYTYSGPPTNIDIDLTLTGTFVPPLSGGDNNSDGIVGRAYLFTDPGAIDQLNNDVGAGLNCLFECYVPDDNVTVSIGEDADVLSNTMAVTLNDGDGFYVGATFFIGGAGGGSASSLQSFTVTFSDSTGLTSLSDAGGGDPDSDGDGIPDNADNCTLVANPGQQDSNGDGYGNACDADLNNDGIINTVDLGLLKAVFFSNDADADFNSDGVVNSVDLGVLKVSFFGMPGPSGVVGMPSN